MISVSRLAVVSLAVLALSACQRPAEEETKADAASPAAPAAAAPTAALPAADANSPEQLSQAFRAAWDRAPPATSPAPEESGGGAFTYASGELTPLGGDRYAFISKGAGEEGHVSPGALAVHYLQRTPDGFRRVDAAPLIVVGGTFGKAPDWSVRPGLLPNPAIIAESGGTWQGYTCAGAAVIELTPERPVLRADYVRLYYTDDGAVEDPKQAETMEGRLVPGTPGRDFAVQYSGASRARVVWRLGADGTYRPADTPADLPWC